jgi:heme exporter protein B
LLVLMKLSFAVFVTNIPVPVSNILLLIGSDVLVIMLALILFPFLWKD